MAEHGVIYGLADPDTHEVRYVGQTKLPVEERLRQHIRAARCRTRDRYVYDWIRSLSAPPTIVILERDPPGGLNEAERAWIAYLRGMGCRLTNLTDGGEITCPRAVSDAWTDERRASRAAAMAALNRSRRGVSLTADHREKIGATQRGKPWSAGRRATYPKHSDAAKARISAGVRRAYTEGRITRTRPPVSDETKAKLRIALQRAYAEGRHSRVISAEHRAKISVTKLARRKEVV